MSPKINTYFIVFPVFLISKHRSYYYLLILYLKLFHYFYGVYGKIHKQLVINLKISKSTPFSLFEVGNNANFLVKANQFFSGLILQTFPLGQIDIPRQERSDSSSKLPSLIISAVGIYL